MDMDADAHLSRRREIYHTDKMGQRAAALG